MDKTARLRVCAEAHAGHTVLTERYGSAPLKLAKPFAFGKQAGAMVMDVSPGLLSGDRYELKWRAGVGTALAITNQSYTKVHPCSAGQDARVRQQFFLEAGAWIEQLNEPLMLYKDANYASDTEVRLSPGAVWLQGEVLCPGRTLRGEKFAYTRLDNRICVYAGEELLYQQRQRIVPQLQRLAAPGAWGPYTHSATLLCFGDSVGTNEASAVQQALRQLPAAQLPELRWAVTPAFKQGLAVVALGRSAWPLELMLRTASDALRAALKGWGPLTWRK